MKRGRRFGLPEERQLLIFWTCRNYKTVSSDVREKIDRLCDQYGKPPEALKEAILTDRPLFAVALDFFMTEKDLYYQVRDFFRNW